MSSEKPKSAANGEVGQSWQATFEACERGLRAFLKRRLGQDADVDDCLQAVNLKMIQADADVPAAARRAWLFRVAANESARMWRRKGTTQRVLQKHAGQVDEISEGNATDKVILNETTQQLYRAIETLPETTQQIIRLRIHENLTFQQIADQLNIPLGTALTRMRRAMERLRNEIKE